jgi:hypothetical protein
LLSKNDINEAVHGEYDKWTEHDPLKRLYPVDGTVVVFVVGGA